MKCPHCSSDKTVKQGILESGGQRYICRSCGKRFSDRTIIRPKLEKTCPVCASTEIVRNGKSNGNQRYLCKNCGKKFEEEKYKEPNGKVYPGVICPNCGNNRVRKRGISLKREQYFRCSNCGHSFALHVKFRHSSESQRKFVIMYSLNLRVPNRDIADYLGLSARTVRNIVNRYKKELQKNVQN